MWLLYSVTSILFFLGVCADPTWPSSIDELEEIMYQVLAFNNRGFGGTVMPCTSEAAGPGRQNAAEWLRTAFHDVASGNIYWGTGGLDASLQFETMNAEDTGPGFNTSLSFYSTFYTSRSSMSDLIALGVYYSVRSCGGPAIPIRGGRIDATTAGPEGFVPQPQDGIGTFKNRFMRLGFNTAQMIQLVACGHTIGGVHSPEFNDIVPPGTPKNEVAFDSTVAGFDNNVVTEYLNNNSTNPLVVGNAVALRKNSDGVVFGADNNKTMQTLTNPATFQSVCQNVLQQMIEVVPSDVVFSDPILPYFVKPVGFQLILNDFASTMTLNGGIRVRTTYLPASSINSLTLTYKNRYGGTDCGPSNCSTTVTGSGVTEGFDDTFFWFPVKTTIRTATGISSFTVALNLANGTILSFDNNGNSYPITDGIMLQSPQSCLLTTSGQLTVTAAVRNDLRSMPVMLQVTNQIPTVYPVASLAANSVSMTQGDCVGLYTFYTASYNITGGMAGTAKIDVTSGSGSTAIADTFNNGFELGANCRPFFRPASSACATPGSSAPPVASPSSSVSSSVGTSSNVPSSGSSSLTSSTSFSSSTSSNTQASSPSTSSGTGTVSSTRSSSTVATTAAGTSTSSAPAAATPTQKQQVGTYSLVGCYKEATDGRRALSGQSMAVDTMTAEICAAFCSAYHYFGTEYGRECYCGNVLDSSSKPAAITDCSMSCAGDKSTYCGAGNRLGVYFSNATTGPTQPPTVGKYNWYGCQTEGTRSRALIALQSANNNMTLESCADFCDGYTYFGTEYSRECYCGNSFTEGSVEAGTYGCSMICVGDPKELCGGPDRLSVYTTKGSSKLLSIHQ
ncbi:WSC domain containing protein [Apiospora aurea]|uniref:WSC domain containing protein n=1 Tax=Apiospora aurea TaxID=335848 RepID=A0ABR1QXA1_9PEZI